MESDLRDVVVVFRAVTSHQVREIIRRACLWLVRSEENDKAVFTAAAEEDLTILPGTISACPLGEEQKPEDWFSTVLELITDHHEWSRIEVHGIEHNLDVEKVVSDYGGESKPTNGGFRVVRGESDA